MANSAQQVANVRGAVRGRRGELPAGPCLLVDDVRFSGWTLAMLAGQLRRRGAAAVYPLALRHGVLTPRRGAALQQHARDLLGVVAHRHVPAAAQPHMAGLGSSRRARSACVGSSSPSRVPQAIVTGTPIAPAKR